MVHYYLGLYETQNGVPPTTQVAASVFSEMCYGNKDQLTCVSQSFETVAMLYCVSLANIRSLAEQTGLA